MGVEMLSKILFIFSNIWFFIFRVSSILSFTGFAYSIFLFVSNNFVSPDPQFLVTCILSFCIGMYFWVNARGLSRWMIGFLNYPLDHNHKAFRADLLGR